MITGQSEYFGGTVSSGERQITSKSGTNPDPDLTVRTALDRAAKRIAKSSTSNRAVEASIRETIANSYADLGLYREAEQQMEVLSTCGAATRAPRILTR